VKKLSIAIAGLAALGGLLFLNARALAQASDVHPAGGSSAAPQSNAPTTKIGVVNILKLIKEFKKADVLGTKILNDAQKYELSLNQKKEDLKNREAKLRTTPEGPQRDADIKTLRDLTMQLQDEDQAAQKDIRKRRDDMAIEIHKNIQTVLDSLARHYGFEMVLTCPDVTDEQKERNSISDAMRKITTPGTLVAWCDPRLNITDECIRWLNHYFKPPEGSVPAQNTGAPANGQPR
jgi:Skp family chaperone for outer membrane proteins